MLMWFDKRKTLTENAIFWACSKNVFLKTDLCMKCGLKVCSTTFQKICGGQYLLHMVNKDWLKFACDKGFEFSKILQRPIRPQCGYIWCQWTERETLYTGPWTELNLSNYLLTFERLYSSPRVLNSGFEYDQWTELKALMDDNIPMNNTQWIELICDTLAMNWTVLFDTREQWTVFQKCCD